MKTATGQDLLLKESFQGFKKTITKVLEVKLLKSGGLVTFLII